MRFRKNRKTRDALPASQESATESDLITYARARCASPGAQALLDEAERGRARREQELPARKQRDLEPLPQTAPLHAYEITPADAAIMRMLSGAYFGPGATVVLPSGKAITGTEMQQWLDIISEQEITP